MGVIILIVVMLRVDMLLIVFLCVIMLSDTQHNHGQYDDAYINIFVQKYFNDLIRNFLFRIF
jgi:hypothetical protein